MHVGSGNPSKEAHGSQQFVLGVDEPLRKDASRENGEFAFNRFYKEFALSIGLGIRLNLGFFIFRLDPAIPVYNPAVVNNFDPNTTYKDRDPWRIKYSRFKDVRWNFAIGYPF